jgi:hypothetical protein
VFTDLSSRANSAARSISAAGSAGTPKDAIITIAFMIMFQGREFGSWEGDEKSAGTTGALEALNFDRGFRGQHPHQGEHEP